MGKIGPSPKASTPVRIMRVQGTRVAAQIGPYFVVDLDLGATKAFGLRLVSDPTDEDLSVGTPSGPIFACNAACAKVNNRLLAGAPQGWQTAGFRERFLPARRCECGWLPQQG